MDEKQELERLNRIFDLQTKAYQETGAEGYEVRLDRLDRTLAMVEKFEAALCKAMDDDFGGRNPMMSLGLDFVGTVVELKFAKKNLRKWMKPERRKVNFPLGLVGAKASLLREPKGVVGNMPTWNFPTNLALSPLAGIFAGGNRCMIKMHENSPATTAVLKEAVTEFFNENELAVFGGGLKVSTTFSSTAFDHILYTGSINVGKLVMEAAAKNLTPVTLELGGKCPVFVSRSANKADMASKVVYGKMSNAGQICLAPDYLVVAEDQKDDVVSRIIVETQSQFSNPTQNDDYTAMINNAQYERVQGLVKDAKDKGAKVTIVDAGDGGKNNKKMPLHILENVNEDMAVMKEEIFGPVLPIVTYKNFDEAIANMRGKDKPLASYYFGTDSKEQGKVIDHVPSGATTVNDVLFHVLQADLPFGGVGNSGMGSYHGRDGFNEFTNPRALYKQGWLDVGKFIRPPFKAIHEKIIRSMM
jgi:coniferyl-aldehyde dehydrogenase